MLDEPVQQRPAAAAGPGEPARPEARAVPFRGGGFRAKRQPLVAWLVFAALLLLWEAGSRTGLISNIVLPAPSEAFAAFMDLVRTGMLWKHLDASLYRLIVGWTAGTALGIVVGLLIGLSSLARAGLLQLVSALFAIPKIALLPLFVVWFGIGEGSKIATILFGTFFPTVI
ncbi:MAG TPA: ABC transporter permease, partial [Acetobacteraceae bacterium]|nr:ABC transporter permease [Acetobacteraceae bacterium]